MSKNLITVTEEQDVSSCAKIMLQNNISSIIVVNNEKNLPFCPNQVRLIIGGDLILKFSILFHQLVLTTLLIHNSK